MAACFSFFRHFTDHNNVRHEFMQKGLNDIVDFRGVLLPGGRCRGLSLRFERYVLRPFYYQRAIRKLSAHYSLTLCLSRRFFKYYSGDLLVDLDDPTFCEEEMNQINQPRVKCVITTTEALKQQLKTAGLDRPCCVIPSGVDYKAIAQVVGARSTTALAGEPNLIFSCPFIYTNEETKRTPSEQGLRTVDMAVEIMQHLWRELPSARLTLVGKPSKGVRMLAERYPQISIKGYVKRDALYEEYAKGTIGLYPRTADFQGRQSIKLLEYLAAGMPVAGIDVAEMLPVKIAKAGVVGSSSGELASRILWLLKNPAEYEQCSRNGVVYAKNHSWDKVIEGMRDLVLSTVEAQRS